MTPWYVSGEGATLLIEFKRDDQFVIPDPGTIKLTIRSNSGLVLPGYNRAVQPDVPSSAWLLNIPADVNITNEERENRFIIVEYLSGGYPCLTRINYRLTHFLPIQTSPQEVRSLLGLRDLEVKDYEIDLYTAYFELLRNNPLFEDYLIAGDDTAMYANRAIALVAALKLLPSLPLRAVKEDTLNNASLIRANVDWDALKASLEQQLVEALDGLEVLGAPLLGAPPLLLLTFPLDPVTNA